jgi:hypothetical protein
VLFLAVVLFNVTTVSGKSLLKFFVPQNDIYTGNNTCSITHVVFVPLGGLETAGLIRDLYDLDCWLRRSGSGSSHSLPETRRKLWQLLTESNYSTATGTDRTLFMPESLSASNKIRTYSAPPDPDLPAKIAPLSPEDEIVIISFLMKEINENYALQLCEFPSMARCSETEEQPVDTVRIFTIGGSHVKRMVGGLVNGNHEIINLSKSGWKADPVAVAEITAKLKSYNLCAADTVVIDPISNSVFCGTVKPVTRWIRSKIRMANGTFRVKWLGGQKRY